MKDRPTTSIPGPLAGHRRRFSEQEKRALLAEARAPGQSMSSVGRRHGLSVSLLFRWRRTLDGPAPSRSGTSNNEIGAENRHLRARVRDLERLLGQRTLELDLMRRALTETGTMTAGLDDLLGEPEGGLDRLEEGSPGTLIASTREGTV